MNIFTLQGMPKMNPVDILLNRRLLCVFAKLASFFTVILFCLPAYAATTDVVYDLKDFNSLHIKGSMKVYFVQSNIFSVRVTASKEQHSRTELSVSGKALIFQQRPKSCWGLFSNDLICIGWSSSQDDFPMKVYVSAPRLIEAHLEGSGSLSIGELVAENLDLKVSGSGTINSANVKGSNVLIAISGSGDIDVKNVKAESLKVSIIGSGDVKVSRLKATTAETEISGSGDVTLTGVVTSQSISITGSGDFSGQQLIVDESDVEIRGSGDVSLSSGGVIHADVRGSGDIKIE